MREGVFWKRFFFVLLLTVSLWGCGTTQYYVIGNQALKEGWSIPASGASWEIGNHGHNAEMAAVEYMPRGEQIENWSSLITTQTFVLTPERGLPSAMLRNMYEDLSRDCPSLKFSVLEDDSLNIVYEWSHLGCQGFPPQHEISRFQLGQIGVHRLAFVTKTTRIDAQLRKEWIDIIRRAVLVTPAPNFSLQQASEPATSPHNSDGAK